ncbi:hypothetical protein JST97_00405 [bacterium]|nr:hypothetical protein [bacterium]
MTEGGAVESKEFRVGDKVAERFAIEEVMPPLGKYPHYRASDPEGNKVVLSQIGRPTKESEPDKVKRGLERATRALSWIRHPGFVIPKEFVVHDGLLFSIFPEAKGTPLDVYIKEQQPPIQKILHWTIDISEMLDQIHEARQPQFVGNLPVRNVLVSADGEVQLLGFDLNPDLKLEFIPVDDSAPKVPDQKFDARTDCWVLGKLIQQMVEAGGEDTRKAYREEQKVRALVQTMTSDDPEKRIANMSTLKSRLELLTRKEKKVDEASLLTAPITVLTVEEEDKFKEIKQRIKYLIGGVVLLFLFIALVGQSMNPDGGW